ncbi:MAG: hypothetical protein RL120_14410 [Gammaproteobacteria bacterium]
MVEISEIKTQFAEKAWPQLRRLLVFQLKLVVDIARDFVFAPLAVVACIIDLVQQNNGESSSFERVMELGRSLERKVNLFEQHNGDTEKDPHSVDGIVDSLEQNLRRGKGSENE